MASKIKLFILVLLTLFVSMNMVSAFELSFQEGSELTVYEEMNPIILHVVIDNTDPSDYVSEASDLSYLNIKVAGKDENFVRLVNERDFQDSGLFIDKDVKETLQVELRLPATDKWQKEYEVVVAGVSLDERQREAKIIVKPTGEQVQTFVDEIPWKVLIIGFIGLVLIIVGVIVFDKFKGKKKVNY